MAHAWLDSLSEDWVSQAGSDNSLQPASVVIEKPTKNPKITNGSRIPRPYLGDQRPHTASCDNSSTILSERSLNEINVRGSRRGPSKLSQEIKQHERGRYFSRSISASTANSVVHNTVDHKSLSVSPIRNRGETPEWKRRLVYGDLSYGEQRDLFTSAGTGLENIFNPPPAAIPTQNRLEEDEDEDGSQIHHDVTMPSSPPVYAKDASTVEIHVDESADIDREPELPQKKQPSPMRYRRTDESADATWSADISRSPDSKQDSAVRSSDPITQEDDNVELRKVSGQTDIRNEDFSPILVSRQQGGDGKTTFTAIEVPPNELRKRLEKLRRNQRLLVAEADDILGEGQATNIDMTGDGDKLEGFINTRRGGRSADGSFRNHLLSSALNDTSELLPEESLQASTPKQYPTVRMEHWEDNSQIQRESPPFLRAPHPSPDKKQPPIQGSSTSPLKLFQPYDTFTNQTLLRRLTQFEGQISDDSQSVAAHQEDDADTEIDGGRMSVPRHDLGPEDSRHTSASVSQFGAGDLDGYEFHKDISYPANHEAESAEDDAGEILTRNQRRPIFDAGRESSPSEAEDFLVTRRRQRSFNSAKQSTFSRSATAKSFDAGTSVASQVEPLLSTPKRGEVTLESKRPRTTPAKDPTPKRRRTLHKSDIAYAIVDDAASLDSVQISHQHMQSIIGKKRKDARQGDLQQMANADVLANRQILRPRTPTPSQRSSIQREHAPSHEFEEMQSRSTKKAATPLPAASSLDIDRKPSIKTEDFINEANKIMAMIRSKAGLASGLASVEESDSDNVRPQQHDAEDSFQESTREPFSRPPSREGRAPPSRPSARQEDPEVLQRLKKYEEGSEMGDIISSSMRSMGLVQDALRADRLVNEQAKEALNSSTTRLMAEQDSVISDPPNIRISRNPSLHDKRSTESLRDGVPSHASSGSTSSNMTGRSIPTGSSRGSDSRKTIVPQSVEHLIPDQVGNMVLDRHRNIWIKRRQASVKVKQNFLPSEGSEDDPFADIPDLSVDMTMELQNLRIVTAQNEQERSVPDAPQSPASASKTVLRGAMKKPQTPVKPVQDEHPIDPDASPEEKPGPIPRIQKEEVEHEISIHEDRVNTPRRRNLTITFSSPIASIIQEVVAHEADASENEASILNQYTDGASLDSIKSGRMSNGKVRATRTRSGSHPTARQISVGGHAFVPRPVSRIDEQDEDSDGQQGNGRRISKSLEVSVIGNDSALRRVSKDHSLASVNFVVTTPARHHDCAVVDIDAAPVISQYVGTLTLSPLSDFTVNHGDESLPLEVSYVVDNHHLITGDHARRVMSINTRALVQKLAEVEPFEPYWEDMRELDVREKRLESLHALGEFCSQLEGLDASSNEIRNLSGIPSSVRHLKITHNCLSSLTSWDHLHNLQYVDVSNNELTDLSALKNLVHLRSLRADNNQLTSLDGIKYHDALLTLRARGNEIEEIDFEGTKLQRLADLDLKGNKIRRISNLDQLVSLSTLNLEDNELESFATQPQDALSSLKYLTLSNNKLTGLDLQNMPHLRLLHADRNCISQLSSFSRARRLDSLSLREQRIDKPLDLSFLSKAYEVRKLYLSGNLLEKFDPRVDFLNLQLLELANCGLQSLPENLGQLMPNLRVVNLNFNAISDLSPLRFIPRLKRILAVGNRLADAAATVSLVSEFPYVTCADLRNNPVTQGFYPPLQALVRKDEVDIVEPFTLPSADSERDATYSSRLDLETRMRRRLYELMFARSCGRMKSLDGLPLRKDIGDIRDAVWIGLAAQGLLLKEDGTPFDVTNGKGIKEESRWEAENSFA
jgi:Leucine-rich repeat (LRR) protein